MVSTRRRNYDKEPSHKKSNVNLLDLPDEVLSIILSYIKYANIAIIRGVCVRLNWLCTKRLNDGFEAIEICCKINEAITIVTNDPLKDHLVNEFLQILIITVRRLEYIGLYVKLKNCAFFPGLIIDVVREILYSLSVAQKLDIGPALLIYISLGSLRRLVDLAEDHFKQHLKYIHLNLRRKISARSQK